MKIISWWYRIGNSDHILLKEVLLVHQREQTSWFQHLSDTLVELGVNVADPPTLSREVLLTKLQLHYKNARVNTVGNTSKLGVLKACI
jgi:hypothetical protein